MPRPTLRGCKEASRDGSTPPRWAPRCAPSAGRRLGPAGMASVRVLVSAADGYVGHSFEDELNGSVSGSQGSDLRVELGRPFFELLRSILAGCLPGFQLWAFPSQRTQSLFDRTGFVALWGPSVPPHSGLQSVDPARLSVFRPVRASANLR